MINVAGMLIVEKEVIIMNLKYINIMQNLNYYLCYFNFGVAHRKIFGWTKG